MLMRFLLLVPTFLATGVVAETRIHRCVLDDGTVAFQEMPCREAAAVDEDDGADVESDNSKSTPDDDGFFDFVNPYDEAAGEPTTAEPALPEPVSQDRTECEKTTRDAIDAIDLEMRETTYTRDQGEDYLEQLLVLTRQLRACKQL